MLLFAALYHGACALALNIKSLKEYPGNSACLSRIWMSGRRSNKSLIVKLSIQYNGKFAPMQIDTIYGVDLAGTLIWQIFNEHTEIQGFPFSCTAQTWLCILFYRLLKKTEIEILCALISMVMDYHLNAMRCSWLHWNVLQQNCIQINLQYRWSLIVCSLKGSRKWSSLRQPLLQLPCHLILIPTWYDVDRRLLIYQVKAPRQSLRLIVSAGLVTHRITQHLRENGWPKHFHNDNLFLWHLMRNWLNEPPTHGQVDLLTPHLVKIIRTNKKDTPQFLYNLPFYYTFALFPSPKKPWSSPFDADETIATF